MAGAQLSWPVDALTGIGPRARLRLTNEFQLEVDRATLAVPHGVQRLLALLALSRHPVSRSRAAGQLWLDVPEKRALGNLRTVLWRLRRLPVPTVRSLDDRIALDPAVEVDVSTLRGLTSQMLGTPSRETLSQLPQLLSAGEILPGWEDEWLIVERERFRELRLHALERAAEMLMELGDFGGAVQAALSAVEGEPLRESAQRLLVRVHLSEGNVATGLRAYRAYRNLVRAELGIEPSEAMDRLVARFLR